MADEAFIPNQSSPLKEYFVFIESTDYRAGGTPSWKANKVVRAIDGQDVFNKISKWLSSQGYTSSEWVIRNMSRI